MHGDEEFLEDNSLCNRNFKQNVICPESSGASGATIRWKRSTERHN